MVAPSLSPESVKLILCNFRKTALRTRLSVFLAILSLHQLGERSMIGHNRLLSHNDLTFFFPSDLSFTDSGIIQKMTTAPWSGEGNEILILPSILTIISNQSINTMKAQLDDLKLSEDSEDEDTEKAAAD